MYPKVQGIISKVMRYMIRNLDRNDPALVLTAFQMIDYMFHMTEDLSIFKQEHLALRMERFFESKLYSYPYLLLARLF